MKLYTIQDNSGGYFWTEKIWRTREEAQAEIDREIEEERKRFRRKEGLL